MSDLRKNWSRVAWNHVRFHCPQSWQPLEIGHRYMVFEDRDGPVMEVKWGAVKGQFSHKLQLDKLASLHKHKLSKTLEPCPLPDKWEKRLNGFDASGFSWQGDATGAKGALIYCTECKNATIIQFFKEGKAPVQVLDSFSDHSDDGLVQWSLFDFSFLLPTQFLIQRHAFLPGKFSLSFKCKTHAMHFYRYSPASVLLAKQDLADFARSVFPELDQAPTSLVHMGCEAVEFNSEPGKGLLGVVKRMSPKPSYASTRLWHVEDKNRIMAVILEGKSPDPGLFEQVCANYEIV